jgi:hypothetical protein
MSGVGLVAGIWTSQILLTAIFPLLTNSVLLQFVENFVLGASLGAAQALVLRKYVSAWWWIFATSCGWSISAIVARAWSNQISGVLNNIFYICLGITQWIALRRYAFAAGWWIVIAAVSVYLFRLVADIVFFDIVSTYLNKIWQIPLSSQILIQTLLGAIPLGLIQAISLCTLPKKTKRSAKFISQLESALFSAPEIADSSQIQILSKMLFSQIDRTWKTETNATQDLIYIVVTAQNGSVIFYHPVNQVAISYVNKTPLPDLVRLSQAHGEVVTNQDPVARFRVVFTTNGEIKIHYWQSTYPLV